MAEKHKRLSVLLAKVLRHDPALIGLAVERKGAWADVDELIQKMTAFGRPITREILEEIVETDEKGRYSFDESGKKIRANQGHSLDVELDMAKVSPPEYLYHGTASRMLDSIFQSGGLRPMSRQFVHLSTDIDTAIKTGRRHGSPVVLRVHAQVMEKMGYVFYLSDNGIWQTKSVPSRFLEIVQ